MKAKKVRITKVNEIHPVVFENIDISFDSTIGSPRTINFRIPSLGLSFDKLWIVGTGMGINNTINFASDGCGNDITIKVEL